MTEDDCFPIPYPTTEKTVSKTKFYCIEVMGTAESGGFFRPETIEHNSRSVPNRFWHRDDAANTARDRYLAHDGVAVRIVPCN